MEIKYRDIAAVYIFSIITLGIYGIYWMVKTKEEINGLGAEIPTAWLIIVPIACLWWVWKYCEGFSNNLRKDNNPVMWFIVWLLMPIIMPAIVQDELNRLVKERMGSQ